MNYCKKCVTPSTRPRVQFNENGVCNACTWAERKKTEIDWVARWSLLEGICSRFRRNDGNFDCIVPCSGGKDGTYVAHQLRELGMNPLCVTFKQPMPTALGEYNLKTFLRISGFNHMFITPDERIYRRYNKDWFINHGMPKQAFVVGISSSLARVALQFGIHLMIYGEQGEVEYGGIQETEVLQKVNLDYLKNIYYEGQDPTEYGYWWKLPSEDELSTLHMTWWSIFEDWDPSIHAKVAINNYGMMVSEGRNVGTYTHYAQLDDHMQSLHAYLMFLKFGFGRCTGDCGIDIRRGMMDRYDAVRLVNELDAEYPKELTEAYLDYFEMSRKEFFETLNKWANKDLLVQTDDSTFPWVLKEPCK